MSADTAAKFVRNRKQGALRGRHPRRLAREPRPLLRVRQRSCDRRRLLQNRRFALVERRHRRRLGDQNLFHDLEVVGASSAAAPKTFSNQIIELMTVKTICSRIIFFRLSNGWRLASIPIPLAGAAALSNCRQRVEAIKRTDRLKLRVACVSSSARQAHAPVRFYRRLSPSRSPKASGADPPPHRRLVPFG